MPEWFARKNRTSNQFVYDYRPIIIFFGFFSVWQGVAWYLDGPDRFSAAAFIVLKQWSEYVGYTINHLGIVMVIGGVLILVGTLLKVWQVRWIGYSITSLVFLTVAEGMRQSGIIYPDASQSGVRTYIFVGFLPVLLAIVAQLYARERQDESKAIRRETEKE